VVGTKFGMDQVPAECCHRLNFVRVETVYVSYGPWPNNDLKDVLRHSACRYKPCSAVHTIVVSNNAVSGTEYCI
jgi:hypothetical protein